MVRDGGLVIKLEKRNERSVTVSRCSIIGKIVADRVVNRRRCWPFLGK